jgi:hypothetical protein
VIRVESAQEILIGLTRPAGMFHRNEAGDQTEYLRGTALRLQQIFFVGNELLGRGRDRPFADDSNFRNFNYLLIRIMGLYGLNDGQQCSHSGQE